MGLSYVSGETREVRTENHAVTHSGNMSSISTHNNKQPYTYTYFTIQELTQINHVHEQKNQNIEKKNHIHDVWCVCKKPFGRYRKDENASSNNIEGRGHHV